MNLKKLNSLDFFQGFDLQYAHDSLTNVLNREMILSYLKYLIEHGRPFSLCLCDIDNFKHVNDNYGHMKGDEVLTHFANVIECSVGDNGVVGRYGGDEFMVILEGITEYNDVWAVCHSIKNKVNKLQFKNMDELNVTLTSGISRYPIDGMHYEDIISTADKALYRGKMKGRNCFIIYLAAKHSSIVLKTENELSYSSMAIHKKIFEILSNKNGTIKENIHAILLYFSTYSMYHNICIQTKDKLLESFVHPLSPIKNFEYINPDLFLEQMNDSNFMFLNNRRVLIQTDNIKLNKELKKQNITSIFIDKIEINGNCYGYLRADMTNSGRIWQNGEMDLLITAAELIAVILYYNNTTLEEVYKD